MNEGGHFTLRCVNTGATLTLSGLRYLPDPNSHCEYIAKLEAAPLSAEVEIFDGLTVEAVNFFDSLNEAWRGWQGSRDYLSLERHLRRAATNDSLGHVTVQVTLTNTTGVVRWKAEHPIVVEVGQLAAIAARARGFFDHRS